MAASIGAPERAGAALDALWARYGRLSPGAIPADVELMARRCLLDWLGCALAGSAEPLAGYARAEHEDDKGPASVLGTDLRLTPKSAAIVNGSAGHALDFDDTNLVGGLHTTAAVAPAALATAEERGATFGELLCACLVGVEIGARLRLAVGDRHYREGWHMTSTLGVFGAAASTAWLLGLDGEAFGRAVGVASSEVSGVHANFGTMTKPFHAGHAAQGGYLAARLAARGFTASPVGFERVMTQTGAELCFDTAGRLDGTWAILDTLFKKFASCAGTQAPIEAALSLRSRVDPGDVVSARAHVHPNATRVCAIARPRRGLEAKFSIPGCVALALLGDDLANPATFSDATVGKPEVVTLASRIEAVSDDRVPANSSFIEVTTEGGVEVGEFRFNGARAHAAELGGQLAAKFGVLAEPVLGARARELRDFVLDGGLLAPVTTLSALARPR